MKKLQTVLLFLCFLTGVFAVDFKQDLSKNVEVKRRNRKQGMEVCIEKIPHVNQRKNYCVPATCSMILRYLDQRYTQKELGRLFHSSFMNGTQTAAVYKAFQQPEFSDFEIVSIYHLRTGEAAEMKAAYDAALNDPSVTVKKVKKNKKNKRRSKNDDSGKGNFWEYFDRDMALKVFPSCRSQLRKQIEMLCREFIDAGIPVLWTVTMTLDPYTPSPDGHMRIINGYVVKDGQITHLHYRDSWRGQPGGHDMPVDNVIAMTKGLFAIVPRGLDRQNINRIAPLLKSATEGERTADR